MISHSMILEEFFEEPEDVKAELDSIEMTDHVASDGVTYPGIIDLEDTVLAHLIHAKLQTIFSTFKPVHTFARYSYRDMTPPNWAHSDRDMTQMLALIYLNKDNGAPATFTLEHIDAGFNKTPQDEYNRKLLLRDSNDLDKWRIVDEFKGYFNRCVVLNADYIHAASPSFGNSKENARCVLTCFFNIK